MITELDQFNSTGITLESAFTLERRRTNACKCNTKNTAETYRDENITQRLSYELRKLDLYYSGFSILRVISFHL